MIRASCLTRVRDQRLLARAVVGHGKAVQRLLKKAHDILAHTKPTASGAVLDTPFGLQYQVDGAVIVAVVVHRMDAASIAHKYLYELRDAFHAYRKTPHGHMTATTLTPIACAAFEPEMHRLHEKYEANLALDSSMLLELHLTLHLPTIRDAAFTGDP
ncbi:hypothetical protein SPRG_13635 [Saprolegnia parasitica CBS 223.65]|uniref:Longin domain-containing protein n=1 Tax=Saprolegnia parasitica (strain CBS 223.65) TaxID=695850 RepID=A0A067BVF7_SAPPC|nr:hypothetical protein SPRG_13635 [Saprolegnia parasitica CBS 223.65]KDO20820.1 hypothetical protein SPRG_13635 [Saprolegnia parasitica CBS 223.65]|eukprot:XP_012208478.1 hypothetical protein SPRG_13635 [Saprolegnia parasitica CBS 223.65]